MKKSTFNDGDQYRPSTREWVNSTINADFLKKHHCSSLTCVGLDDIFGDYRIFTEDASFSTNKTGKWTIALYDGHMNELDRVVVGGAKNCRWAEAAKIALKWLNMIMDEYDSFVDADIDPSKIEDTKSAVLAAAYKIGTKMADEYIAEIYENGENAIDKLRAGSLFIRGLLFPDEISEVVGYDTTGLKMVGVDYSALSSKYDRGYQDRISEALDEAVADAMDEAVADSQPEIDDIILSANDSYETGYLGAALRSLEDINDSCLAVLEDCGKISGCYMVPDDGFFPDLSELYCCRGCSMPSDYADALSNEIENLKAKIAA